MEQNLESLNEYIKVYDEFILKNPNEKREITTNNLVIQIDAFMKKIDRLDKLINLKWEENLDGV